MKILISLAVTTIVLFNGCSDSNSSNDTDTTTPITEAELGEKLFHNKSFSLHRNMACASCHDPEHGFIDARHHDVTDPNPTKGALSVGSDGLQLGGRNAPTAAYAQFSPTFGKYSGIYKGGQFHDGRAASLKVQAGGPPLDMAEMMMASKEDVMSRIEENATLVLDMKLLYGNDIFDDANKSYDKMTQAIAKFEKTSVFAPFDSKYDRFTKGEYQFTDLEDTGYSLFFSQQNTNCATCHTLNSKSEAYSNEIFTNYEYENIGVPRNIEAMDERATLGLQDANATFGGLGGTIKATDLNYTQHLGKTKVPTLRNIAVTGPYMNNGVFKELRTTLEFYDHMAGLGDHPLNPETGRAWIANDNNATINHTVLQATKALPDNKIRALEAFLRTLTDKKYEHLMAPLKD